ncbi:MAG: baseplate J/gp47 family protein, partial [Nitrosomonas sp.]|nr:baseplate J/gp47 family protein [Nitrosomonas sp.]
SDDATLIHGARVGAIHTLFFNRDPLNSPENILQETVPLPSAAEKKNRQLATECWLNTIPVLSKAQFPDYKDLMAYPLLGAPKNTETESLSVVHARIGFIVASKALLLREGKRNISITLAFTESNSNIEQTNTVKQWINQIATVLKSSSTSGPDSDLSEEEKQDIFFKVFRNLFVIHVSGEAGWLPVEEYVPAYSEVDKRLNDNTLRIAFALPVEAPAVVPYSSAVHGEGYETQLPVVRFTLNPKGYLYPYSVLNKLELDWVAIDVSVSGHRTLTLHNHLGQLSSLASFNPLGPLPEVGSYFVVGCAEAAIKQLTHFSVEITWGGLPAGIGGFESYYYGYDGPSNHTDFKFGMSVLMESKWLPEVNVPAMEDLLFETKDTHHASNTLNEHKLISCDPLMPYWSPSDYQQALTAFSYTPSSKSGFFKFTLIAPVDAFGHKKYPQTLARVLTSNAKQRFGKMLKKEPNAPYTPVVTSILANYKATARVKIGNEESDNLPIHQEKIIHLHPMGWEDSMMNLSGQPVYLLPQYVYSGNLLIGLEGFEEGGLLTLYFHLRENSLSTDNLSVEQLNWYFLSSNQWLPLATKEIVSDSTQGFMTSGIVTLNVPSDINLKNTIMPDSLFWLRVSADQDMQKFCSLYSIYAQALKVSRHLNNTETYKPIVFNPLPSGSIKQVKQSIPGLDYVWQVQPSMGGKSAENKIDVRIRMSERLRHKHRALLPIDYEQLILANFPQIYKVKCFANLAPERNSRRNRIYPCIRPGHVTIVLLPYPIKQAHYGTQLWLSGHLVNAVKDFITRYTSPFVTVHFVNPVYETIQVRCTVKLKNGSARGMCLGKLNEAISAYISPWHDTVGYTAHFGWRINMHDVQSYIQQQDFVDRVTNFSVLRITPDGDALFDLFDSVVQTHKIKEFCEITPKYPWSISEPMREHFIEVDDSFVTIEPEITGIGELEIGSTFIVLNRDGETK